MSSIFSGDSLQQLVPIIGYAGLSLVLFLETGFFLGFIFPGDSLLFVVGVLTAKGIFHFWIIVPLLIVMSIVGYFVGYWFGGALGKWLLSKDDTWYFKHKHLDKTRDFYHKYGVISLFLGRFIPVVRTFIPILAGTINMNFKVYSICNIFGAILWVGGVCSLGYVLGTRIESIDAYLIPIVAAILFLSVLPVLIQWSKSYISSFVAWFRGRSSS